MRGKERYCYRCGFVWISQTKQRPVRCPNCKCSTWYLPKRWDVKTYATEVPASVVGVYHD